MGPQPKQKNRRNGAANDRSRSLFSCVCTCRGGPAGKILRAGGKRRTLKVTQRLFLDSSAWCHASISKDFVWRKGFISAKFLPFHLFFFPSPS
ncbi:hypothetical protein Naga_100833g3 [Nannochloropsis gaditana]|uniref:Uncharacterized protein n=1 Tax=Nannochloropsis gaditana TaxID=72520 RepID=W7TK00_9STRA|nr:hypothetical protein Naga_100833g3 [Nannochloropsis gaditana]